MRAKYLFPHWLGPIGYLLAIPGLLLGFMVVYHEFEIPGFGVNMRAHSTLFSTAFENLTNELAIILSVTGLLLIAFSRRKNEDELTARLRLDALYWAVVVNYTTFFGLIIISDQIIPAFVEVDLITLTLDGNSTLAFNLYMPLIIFIARYNFLLYRNQDNYIVPKLRYLPARPYRKIGIAISLVCLIWIESQTFSFFEPSWKSNVTEILFYFLIPGLLLWGFSRSKNEDEGIAQLRLESLQLAVYLNFALLLIFTLSIYGVLFLVIAAKYMYSLLVFFNVIFEIKKYLYMRQEELNTEKGGILR
ncbi:MAG: hypothetical protein EOP48_34255 [Sphingobacteriales bacterium]|nr:MAG: hypothetical protein EOP48_34255 [Sphingobacteriales bacterium]